jgi:hypothetical protein
MRMSHRPPALAVHNPHRDRLVVHHREDLIRPASPHGQQHHSHPKTHCQNSIHEKRLTKRIGAFHNFQRFLMNFPPAGAGCRLPHVHASFALTWDSSTYL